ncbi:MAG TPA: 2-dehydro-3-deoxygalactonokinase [Casimicrobiaceae bacterium]
MGSASLIAIDWGTTAARAYLMNARGDVDGERSSPLGIARVEGGRYAEALSTLLGDWADDGAPRLACGMIGSRQGWVEAPYVACPASLDMLATGLAHVQTGALTIVPGLVTRDRHGVPDVMRGEETQLLGAVAADESVLAVLPGTHSKWARVERGTVVDFATWMTGELFATLLEHSILGRMAERGAAASPDAFARGVRRGLDDGGLAHDIFGARTLALVGELANRDVADWLSGLLIGREIRDARAWADATRTVDTRVRIIGSDVLAERYATALAMAQMKADRGAPDAAARGLWRIAGQAGLLH